VATALRDARDPATRPHPAGHPRSGSRWGRRAPPSSFARSAASCMGCDCSRSRTADARGPGSGVAGNSWRTPREHRM